MSFSQRPDQQVQNGRHDEFMLLLLPLRDRLARYARAVARTREEADDLIGDTVLAALEGFGSLRSRDGFASYLFRIASRLQKRRRWRRRLFGEIDDAHAHELRSSAQSPESSTEVVLLYRALDALPSTQREAVVLFEISGLPMEDIREIQGGSLSAVKSRVSRGRKELARLLGARVSIVASPAANRIPTRGIPTNGIPTNGVPTDGVATSGIPTDGVATGGIPTNGIPKSGISTNDDPTNGVLTSGIPTNGVLTSGIPTNGVLANGIPANGIPTNGTPTNGIPTNGAAADGSSTNGATSGGAATNGSSTNGIAPSDRAPAGGSQTDSQLIYSGPQING